MKDIVVVQVSHKFEKIPFKSMYCVAGLPLIILYVKKLINEGKKVLVATSTSKKDNDLVEILEKFKVSYFRGSLKKINGENLKNKKNFNQKFIDNTFLDNHRGNFRNVNSLFTIRTFEDFTIFKKFIEKQDNILNTSSKILLKKFHKQKKLLKRNLKKDLKKKRLIILGGSHDQTKTIQTTNNQNIKSVVFDRDIESPNKMLSHYFIFKSATNTADIIYFAQKIKVNGVILQGPDFPQVSSSIEQFLRKKNIPIKAAKICTNKFRMKKFLRKVGIPVPNFQLLKKNDKKKIIFKFPVVIKPLDRSGSRGVLLCENLKNFHVLKKKSSSQTNKNYLLIEEYLDGPQISTETFILNNKIFTPGYVDRNYEMLNKTKPQILENGGTYPSKHFEYYNQINSYIKIIAQKLKIRNGVIKGDIVIHKNKIYFIEIAVRLSGGDFSETMIPLSSSFDLIKNSINLSLGNKIKNKDLKINFSKLHFANRYFFAKKGKLIKINGIDRIKKKSWLKKIKIFKKIGDNLSTTTNHSNRLGTFFIEAKTKRLLEKRINEVYRKVSFKIV